MRMLIMGDSQGTKLSVVSEDLSIFSEVIIMGLKFQCNLGACCQFS